MDNELQQFAAALEASRNEYLKQQSTPPGHTKSAPSLLSSVTRTRRPAPAAPPAISDHRAPEAPAIGKASAKLKQRKAKDVWKPKGKVVHRVTLRVRKKEIAVDEFYTHDSFKLSKLDAEKDAKDAANRAGFPVIAFIEEWETF